MEKVLFFYPVSARAKKDTVTRLIQEIFPNVGFIRPTPPKVDVIIEDDAEEDLPDFVVHGVVFQNWNVVDIPVAMHISD